MEVAQNRGLTLCSTDALSDSDDETPEDLGLSTTLSNAQSRKKNLCFNQKGLNNNMSVQAPFSHLHRTINF